MSVAVAPAGPATDPATDPDRAGTTPLPASRGARVLCYLVDAVVVGLVCGLVWWLADSWRLALVVLPECALAITLARARTGRTPGGVLTHTTASVAGGTSAPGLRRQALRTLVQGLLQLTVVGPLVTAALSRDGQDLADRVAGLAVSDTRRAAVEELVAHRLEAPQRRADAHRQFMPAPTPVTRPQQAVATVAALDAAEELARSQAQQPSSGPQVVTFTHTQATRGAGSPTGNIDLPATEGDVPGVEEPRHECPRESAPGSPGESPHEYRHGAHTADAAASPGVAPAVADRLDTGSGPVAQPDAGDLTHMVAGGAGEQTHMVHSGFVLEVDTGERVPLTGTIVLGRGPVAGDGEVALTLADPTRSMSRTHARVGVRAGRIWVQDAMSANGSAVVGSNGDLVALPAGRRVAVQPGTVLAVGERRIRLVGA